MKLIALQEIDHGGLRRVGDVFEEGNQFAEALIKKGLCAEYSEKLAKKMAESIKTALATSVLDLQTETNTPKD